jgi:hypothetical protein
VSLSRDQAAAIRQKLLETLAAETDKTVRDKISDAVAEVARQYTESGQLSAATSLLPHQSAATGLTRQLQVSLGPNSSGASSS